jgi:hypothetical protein
MEASCRNKDFRECLKRRRKPQRHKGNKGMEVLFIFVAASEEEIKKMDRILGSTERVFYPSF